MDPELQRALGHIPDLFDAKDRSYSYQGTKVPRGEVKNVQSVNLYDEHPLWLPQLNQGSSSSCVAHATASALGYLANKFIFEGKNKDAFDGLSLEPSRRFIYYNTRVLDARERNKDPYWPSEMTDKGSSIRNAMKSINAFGICPEAEWDWVSEKGFPKVANTSYHNEIIGLNDRPSERAYDEASSHHAVEYLRLGLNPDAEVAPQSTLDATGVIILDSMRECLVEGYPVVFAITWYYKDHPFEKKHPDDKYNTLKDIPAIIPSKKERHAVLAIGFNNERSRILCHNSWGGQESRFWLPYVYILDFHSSTDFWMIRQVDDKTPTAPGNRTKVLERPFFPSLAKHWTFSTPLVDQDEINTSHTSNIASYVVPSPWECHGFYWQNPKGGLVGPWSWTDPKYRKWGRDYAAVAGTAQPHIEGLPEGTGISVVHRRGNVMELLYLNKDNTIHALHNTKGVGWKDHPILESKSYTTARATPIVAHSRGQDHVEAYWIDGQGAIVGASRVSLPEDAHWTPLSIAPAGSALIRTPAMGEFASNLASISLGPDHVELFWVHQDTKGCSIQGLRRTAAGWSKTPVIIGPEFSAASKTRIACTGHSTSEIYVWWVSPNGALMRGTWDGKNWTSQEASFEYTARVDSDLKAIKMNDNHFYVFWVGPDKSLRFTGSLDAAGYGVIAPSGSLRAGSPIGVLSTEPQTCTVCYLDPNKKLVFAELANK